MSTLAPTPRFTPAQPPVCAYCGNPHPTDQHPVLEVLNRQTELLAVMAGILEPKRYRLSQASFEDGTGKATVIFPNVPGGVGKLFLVERSVIWTNSTGSPTLGVYVTEALPSITYGASNQPIVPALDALNLHDYSNLAIAANDNTQNPILYKGAENLIFQWASLSAGARVVARVQLRQCWQAVD